MRLIRNIEINYFRSIYQAKLKDLPDNIILSGNNDSGKSNILKALNLFFNIESDWKNDFDFYKDFSLKRLSEVRKESIKGKQFISIAVEFNRPKNFDGSLPKTFKVQRTWHRDTFIPEEKNNLDILFKNNQALFPGTLQLAKRFLGIFLNRVHYEYVPAVKERSYYDHLLSRLQKALLHIATDADSAISDTAKSLAKHIEGKIGKLKIDFKRATGIESLVEPPDRVAELFQAFIVKTVSEEDKIPLILRGDGIQALFVSSVLHYICENSRDFFIWGFEEPENSLEYSHVFALAKDFINLYTKKAQIFITTHSPAFTSLRSKDNKCYRIYRQDVQSKLSQFWPETKNLEERNKLNIEMGFFRIQENLHEEFVSQNEELKKIRKQLKNVEDDIKAFNKPLLLTEGKTDKQILEVAWTKCKGSIDQPFIIRAVDPTSGIQGGAGGAQTLAKMIESIHPEDRRKAIALFDRDQEGVKCFKNLSNNFKTWRNNNDIKIHGNGLAFAVLLPGQ